MEIGQEPEGMVCLRVQDNGQGFDWKTAVSAGGLGLTSMRERVEAVGGTITYDSNAGQGTTIAVCLKMKDSQ